MPRYGFDITFGVIMIAAGIFLWLSAKDDHSRAKFHASQISNGDMPASWTLRDFTDADRTRHRYAYNPTIGIALSVFVGFISSLLGVGGGFIHVPV